MRISFAHGAKAQRRADIEKAASRVGRKSTVRQKQLDGIAGAMANAMALSMKRGIRAFKNRVSQEELERLFADGDIEGISRAIPWDKLGEDVAMAKRYETAALKGSEFTIPALPAPARELQVSTENPRLRRYIEGSSAALVTDMADSGMKVVRSVLFQAVSENWTPKQAAKVLREAGLGSITEKQMARIELAKRRELEERARLSQKLRLLEADGKLKSETAKNVRAKLLTLQDDKINARMMKRIDDAQALRVQTIARTEMTAAVNAGQEMVWAEAMDRGLIERGKVFKVWVSVPDEDRSDICAELDGKRVPLDGEFYSEVTGESYSSPPAHPNCRSAVVIDFE